MDRIITGANRPTMGTGAYQLVDDPSATSFRMGATPRKGPTNDAPDDGGDATHRNPIMAQKLGAQYRITASRGPYSETNSAVQANGRIMPATTGSNRNFRSAQMYGAM